MKIISWRLSKEHKKVEDHIYRDQVEKYCMSIHAICSLHQNSVNGCFPVLSASWTRTGKAWLRKILKRWCLLTRSEIFWIFRLLLSFITYHKNSAGTIPKYLYNTLPFALALEDYKLLWVPYTRYYNEYFDKPFWFRFQFRGAAPVSQTNRSSGKTKKTRYRGFNHIERIMRIANLML